MLPGRLGDLAPGSMNAAGRGFHPMGVLLMGGDKALVLSGNIQHGLDGSAILAAGHGLGRPSGGGNDELRLSKMVAPGPRSR
jgi:hypothetical protein